MPSTPETQTRHGRWTRYIGATNIPMTHSFSHLELTTTHSSPSSIISSSSSVSRQNQQQQTPVTQLQTPTVPNNTQRHTTSLSSVGDSNPDCNRSREKKDDDDIHGHNGHTCSPSMTAYSNPPSPLAPYGINGGLIVTEPDIMQ